MFYLPYFWKIENLFHFEFSEIKKAKEKTI